MAISDELDDVLGGIMAEFDSEQVTIYSHTSGLSYTGQALISGGAMNFDAVTGGTYEKDAFTLTVRKSDCTFTPEPGMLVDARDKVLRIPETPGAVTVARAHYRVEVCGRDVPV